MLNGQFLVDFSFLIVETSQLIMLPQTEVAGAIAKFVTGARSRCLWTLSRLGRGSRPTLALLS